MKPVTPALWRATFIEATKQALRTFQNNIFDTETGSWVSVDPSSTQHDWSDLWPPHQWHVAFEIIFYQTPEAIAKLLPQRDDLILFVYWSNIANSKRTSRVFARRRKGYSLPHDLQLDKDEHHTADTHENQPNSTTKTTESNTKRNDIDTIDIAIKYNATSTRGNSRTITTTHHQPSTTNISHEVDWRNTFLLNLALQTHYTLTVLRTTPWDMDTMVSSILRPGMRNLYTQQSGATSPGGSIHVSKHVHASPSKAPVNLDQSKAHSSTPVTSYPDLSFSVDDYTEVFGSLVLHKQTDCYCVTLHADVDASWCDAMAATLMVDYERNEPLNGPYSDDTIEDVGSVESLQHALQKQLDLKSASPHHVPLPSPLHRKKERENILLFSGFVSSHQLRTALRNRQESMALKLLTNLSRVASPAAASSGSRQVNHVVLRGPGGIGSADVALTALLSETTGDNTAAVVVDSSVSNGGALGGRSSTTRTESAKDRGGRDAAARVSSSSSPSQPPGRGVFGAALNAAKEVMGGIIARQGKDDVTHGFMQLHCALMSVTVPVEALAEEMLKAIYSRVLR